MSETGAVAQNRQRHETAPPEGGPLTPFKGERPPAPDWFTEAVNTPYRTESLTVEGARIVYQQWGDRSKPGLLLAHGNGAQSHWFDFIAPFLTDRYNVIAPTFSGMGDSDWRDRYSFDLFTKEQLAVCEHAGLFAHERKPIMVAHSFGGLISMNTGQYHGDLFGAAVIVDSHIEPPGHARPRPPKRTSPNRVYPDLATALSRFRLAPPQPCDNLYAVDHIARTSLKEAEDADGNAGWTWKFDPFIFASFGEGWDESHLMLSGMTCPVAFMRGADSSLVSDEVADYMSSLQGHRGPTVTIPKAYHHIMLDQPLAFVAALHALFESWAHPLTVR